MLTYEMLNALVDPANKHHLDFLDVDVRRLHDDRPEVQYGDEIALVATFTAVITADGQKKLKKFEGCRNLAAGEPLIAVGTDAAVISKTVALDADGVTRWIRDHYEFTFLLNGREHASLREMTPPPVTEPVPSRPGSIVPPVKTIGQPGTVSPRRELVANEVTPAVGLARYPVAREVVHETSREFGLPWLRRLNTAAVNDDLVDIDVRIVARTPAPAPATTNLLLVRRDTELPFDNATIQIRLEVNGEYASAADLEGMSYRLPLQSDTGAEVQLVLTVTGTMNVEPPEAIAATVLTKSTRTKH